MAHERPTHSGDDHLPDKAESREPVRRTFHSAAAGDRGRGDISVRPD
ncbi:hypothetical protein [Streptomyces apocyni]|nr:hypothetical protein [Streptomyces apocyni]